MGLSFNHLGIANYRWRLRDKAHATFDMTKITYFEPIGLTFLAGAIIKQMEISKTAELIVHDEVLNYLERMDFFKFIDNRFSDDVRIVPQRPSIHRYPRRDSLVEFHDIDIKDENELEECIESLSTLCSERANYVIPYAYVTEIFGELLDNIFRHSKTTNTLLTAQRASGCIRISISDLGVGIPHNIRSKYGSVDTDNDAIRLATEPEITTYAEGGWGLTILRDRVVDPADYLFIASNHGCVTFRKNRSYTHKNYDCDFSGTFVEICFKIESKYREEIEDIDLPF